MIGFNGGLIGKQNATNVTRAVGSFTLQEQLIALSAKQWPYSALDADAQAYISLVESADGQALESSVAAAINDFVVNCKVDGIWTAMNACCILAGARTLAGCLVPLKGSAPSNFNFISSDYNRKTGLNGNGSSKYLLSNRASNADPQNDNHNAVYVSTAATNGSFPIYMGVGNTDTGSTHFGPAIASGAMQSRNRASTSENIVTAAGSTGFVGMTRSSSASYTFRRAGANTSFTRTSQALLTWNTAVYGSTTSAGGSVQLHSNGRLSFYSIGASLDLALLDTRISQLMTYFANVIA